MALLTRSSATPRSRLRTSVRRSPMLEARDLTVLYENALALNRFSLDMRVGEVVGVFGSNGAGKTTLMTTLSGLVLDRRDREARKGGERITVRGEIRFEGED